MFRNVTKFAKKVQEITADQVKDSQDTNLEVKKTLDQEKTDIDKDDIGSITKPLENLNEKEENEEFEANEAKALKLNEQEVHGENLEKEEVIENQYMIQDDLVNVANKSNKEIEDIQQDENNLIVNDIYRNSWKRKMS